MTTGCTTTTGCDSTSTRGCSPWQNMGFVASRGESLRPDPATCSHFRSCELKGRSYSGCSGTIDDGDDGDDDDEYQGPSSSLTCVRTGLVLLLVS